MRSKRQILNSTKPVRFFGLAAYYWIDRFQLDTRMADRCAQVTSAPLSTPPASKSTPSNPPAPPPVVGRRGVSTAGFSSSAAPEPHVQLRIELSNAQQERSELQARLDRSMRDLERLKARSKVDHNRITQLTSELGQLSLRFRDIDEETRGKAKLLDNVQDETVTLTLQLNLAEEEVKKLRGENQELVDRWMKRKGEEADKMNQDSRF
jgi:hypothetical protein